MTVTRDIDYSDLDGLIAEQLIRQNGGEELRRVIVGILRQGGDAKKVSGRLLEFLPTWTGTARQLEVIAEWLESGEGE